MKVGVKANATNVPWAINDLIVLSHLKLHKLVKTAHIKT